MPRTFIAITLPITMRSTFASCREAFCAADPDWRSEKWVADENLHVTLRFLGIVPEHAYEEVVERVTAMLADVEPYRLRLDEPRAIPRPRSASLLWVAPSTGAGETAALVDRIARATAFLGFEPDGRAHKTHVTLCRARHPRRVPTVALDEMERIIRRAEDRSVCMSVREVTLFASTLTPRGPIYEERAIIPLGR